MCPKLRQPGLELRLCEPVCGKLGEVRVGLAWVSGVGDCADSSGKHNVGIGRSVGLQVA